MYWRKCYRCLMIIEAEAMRVDAYEWPLPADEHLCDEVMFELLMPSSLAVLRDALFLIRT